MVIEYVLEDKDATVEITTVDARLSHEKPIVAVEYMTPTPGGTKDTHDTTYLFEKEGHTLTLAEMTEHPVAGENEGDLARVAEVLIRDGLGNTVIDDTAHVVASLSLGTQYVGSASE